MPQPVLAPYDPTDPVSIPPFLRRERTPERDALIEQILNEGRSGVPRVWAPILSPYERYKRNFLKQMQEEKNIFVDNPASPVQVVTTARENLRLYDNLEAFITAHDFEDFPVTKVLCYEGVSYVQVKAEGKVATLSAELKDMPKVDTGGVYEQNGVKRPKDNSITGKAWAVYDKYRSEEKDPKTSGAFEYLVSQGMNISTVRVQYGHWMKFNGLKK